MLRKALLITSWIITIEHANSFVSRNCIACICHASSLCDVSTFRCETSYCGPFNMIREYWLDGDKPTINDDNPNDPQAFFNCANDLECAAVTVDRYMEKYQTDCNIDGTINCDDFIKIHFHGGGDDCKMDLPEEYTRRYYQCKGYLNGTSL